MDAPAVGHQQARALSVLFDENNFTADILQKLTNSLCYT